MSLNSELKNFYSVNDPRSFESYLSSSGTEASVNGTPTLTSTVQCSTRTIKGADSSTLICYRGVIWCELAPGNKSEDAAFRLLKFCCKSSLKRMWMFSSNGKRRSCRLYVIDEHFLSPVSQV